MNVEIRKRKDGTQYFSFLFWDGKKKVRLKRDEHPDFQTIIEAQKFANAKSAEYDCAKAKARQRLEWKNKFYKFKEFSNDYIKYCKSAQPNSWQNTERYLHHYVLYYFLDIKNSNNPNNWYLFYEQFKDWLEHEAETIHRPKRKISYSTKNHCIKCLNTFSTFLLRNGHVDPANVFKLKSFSSYKIGSRDSGDLVSVDEYGQVYDYLAKVDETVATFFQTAYFTGMRFNEILGLSLSSLYKGQFEDTTLALRLKNNSIDYCGYLMVESQPVHKSLKRNDDFSIPRKPLKSKKVISSKNTRIIPLTSKENFNNLVKLYKKQQELKSMVAYGTKDENYLFFSDVPYSRYIGLLHEAYKFLNLSFKGYHCCRHTRCTELVGQTGDFILAKFWLGHEKLETQQRYTHIYEKAALKSKKKHQTIDFV